MIFDEALGPHDLSTADGDDAETSGAGGSTAGPVWGTGDGGLACRNRDRDEGHGEEMEVDRRASNLDRFEPDPCVHRFLRRLSWQHIDGDAETLVLVEVLVGEAVLVEAP